MLVAILVIVYRRKRKRRDAQEATLTTSSESENSLSEDATVQTDLESQEGERNLRNSTGEQGDSVVVAIDVHPQLSTIFSQDFLREDRRPRLGDAQHGTYHTFPHHNPL